MNNLNLLFNKTYYDYFDYNIIPDQTNCSTIDLPEGKRRNADHPNFSKGFQNALKRKNDIIFSEGCFYKEISLNNLAKIYMKTTYPGVLVGTGYAHGTGWEGVDNDVNCGFSFDYLTGMPYIPASSVKGILRSGFEHPEMIKNILQSIEKRRNKRAKADNLVYSALGKENEVNNELIKLLENSIFGDDDKNMGVDVFFDGLVCNTSGDSPMLGSDYITPHKEETQNPVPIMLIKIMPDVEIEFNFFLKDSVLELKKDDAEQTLNVSREDKYQLFIEILRILGVGAKTNVGYGNLVPIKEKNNAFIKDLSDNESVSNETLLPNAVYAGVVAGDCDKTRFGNVFDFVSDGGGKARVCVSRNDTPKKNTKIKIQLLEYNEFADSFDAKILK